MSNDVWVSLIGLTGVFISTSGAVWVKIHVQSKNIGKSNGHGTIAHMVEHTLESIGSIHEKLDNIHNRVEALEHFANRYRNNERDG